MTLSLSFLGGVGTVTGSRFLLEDGQRKVLVDCGLFQGLKQLRLKNWERFPVDPATIDNVLLTHAHLDHSGYLPALVRDGFRGKIYCSKASQELCAILLRDSGRLQEQDADFANRHGFSKHRPALPLYTFEDAERTLPSLAGLDFHQPRAIPSGPTIHLRHAGHILGAASIECEWAGKKVVFSGDIGRFNDPVMIDPEPIEAADYLVVESTYGNRRHEAVDPLEALAEIIARTTRRGGTIIIPAFAVGRAQSVLYYLERLRAAGRLANVPVFLDSPMAIDATELLCRFLDDHRLKPDECSRSCKVAQYVRSPEESKALTANRAPKVIVSASGMATGGRVLHHLKSYVGDSRNTVLFTGFQAAGTRGRAMVEGAENIKIHGKYFPVRAEIQNLSALSAHADADEIIRWLKGFARPPRMTFISHGEPTASDTLRHRIEEELGWQCKVPQLQERVSLE